MKLQRAIGARALFLTAIGGMVGSGWLFGPMYAAKIAGPGAILSWVIGGVLMMLIALTFAELASTFPVAGGMVRFSHMSHDAVVSFTVAWMAWLSGVAVAPIETMALLQYTSNYFPHIVKHVHHQEVLTQFGMLIAAILLAFMIWLNQKGAKLFAKTGSVITLIKLAVPLITFFTLLAFTMHWHNFHNVGGFIPQGWHGVLAALPTAGVIYSFIGYSPVIQLAGEAKKPQRAIPLAIIGALSMCIVLYVCLQFIFIAILPAKSLAHGWAALQFAGINGPFAGIAASLGLTWLMLLIYADALISPFGVAFFYTAATSRLTLAMSQNGYFPENLQALNKQGVPMKSMIINYLVGLILLLPFPGWQSMVGFLVSAVVIAYIVGPIALVSLRELRPNARRPFKLPFAKIIAPLAFCVCNLLIYWTGWHTIEKILVALLIGYLFLFTYHFTVAREKLRLSFAQSWWLAPYFCSLGVISYLGNFGGGIGLIGFGMDALVIAIMSFIIFQFAVRARNAVEVSNQVSQAMKKQSRYCSQV